MDEILGETREDIKKRTPEKSQTRNNFERSHRNYKKLRKNLRKKIRKEFREASWIECRDKFSEEFQN